MNYQGNINNIRIFVNYITLHARRFACVRSRVMYLLNSLSAHQESVIFNGQLACVVASSATFTMVCTAWGAMFVHMYLNLKNCQYSSTYTIDTYPIIVRKTDANPMDSSTHTFRKSTLREIFDPRPRRCQAAATVAMNMSPSRGRRIATVRGIRTWNRIIEAWNADSLPRIL